MSFRIYQPRDFRALKEIAIEKWGDKATWSEKDLKATLEEMYQNEEFGLHPVFEYRYVLNRINEAKEMLGEIKGEELTDLFGTTCASRTIWTTQSIGSELESLQPLTTEDYINVYLNNLGNPTNQDYMIWYISRFQEGDDLEAKRIIFHNLVNDLEREIKKGLVSISWKNLTNYAKQKR